MSERKWGWKYSVADFEMYFDNDANILIENLYLNYIINPNYRRVCIKNFDYILDFPMMEITTSQGNHVGNLTRYLIHE